MSPLLATANGHLQQATPGARGTCPGCGAAMTPKCGVIVTWHWAHAAGEACDPWRTGETEWHLQWKRWFHQRGAKVEVPTRRNGELHIADVMLANGHVIELAGVYPPAEQIPDRERFYGDMSWLYNAQAFADRVDVYEKDRLLRFRFKQPVKVMTLHRRRMFWHDVDDNDVLEVAWIRRYQDRNGRGARTYGGAGSRAAPPASSWSG